MLLALKFSSILAMKLVSLLKEGDITELFGPFGQPESSLPTSDPP
jgi:hypothetical protein